MSKINYAYTAIKDIGTIVTGKTPATANAEYYNGPYMFISPADLHGEYKIESSGKTITQKGLESIKSNSIDGTSVLVGCIGWDMGNVSMCFKKCATNQQINSITKIKKLYNPYYLYYWLSTKKGYLFSIASVTRTPILSKGTFEDVLIPIPEKKIQDNVAQVLLSIDKKIINNSKINDNLQQQFKLIYDYWFNQFNFPDENSKPYQSSGGAMVWNDELQREIPQGWECVSLGSLLSKNAEAFDYSTIAPTIDLSIMPSSSIALDQLNSSDKFTTNLFKMHEGDILFGSIRPYLRKAGIAPFDGVVAGTIHSYHVLNDEDYNFVLFTICRDIFFEYAVRVSTGTKMPVVSSDNILSFKVPYSRNIAKKFNAINVKSTICRNVQESHLLKRVRDWLLPMLLNGQATIPEVADN